MRYLSLFVFCTIVLLAAGCDSAGEGDPVPLPGTEWTLTAFVENGQTTDVGTSEITLSFDGEETIARGSSSINGYAGSYRIPNAGDSPRELRIRNVSSTRAMEREGSRYGEYLQLLEQIDRYRSDGEVLVLARGGKPVLAFEAR